MKYQCEHCKSIFLHPAKQTEYSFNGVSLDDFAQEAPKEFMHPRNYTVTAQIEVAVCPFCRYRTFAEFVEVEASIISVKLVSLEEVDGWLLQGYVVRELYAKTATLIKTEIPKPKGETIAEIIEKVKNPDPDDNESYTNPGCA